MYNLDFINAILIVVLFALVIAIIEVYKDINRPWGENKKWEWFTGTVKERSIYLSQKEVSKMEIFLMILKCFGIGFGLATIFYSLYRFFDGMLFTVVNRF